MSAVQVAEVWLPSYILHADFHTVFFLPLGEWNPVEGVWHVHKVLWRSRADVEWFISQVAGAVMPPNVQVCFVPEEAWLTSRGVIPAYHSRVYSVMPVADHTSRSSGNRFRTPAMSFKPFGSAGQKKQSQSMQRAIKTALSKKRPLLPSRCAPIPGIVPHPLWNQGGFFGQSGVLLSPPWMHPGIAMPPAFPPEGSVTPHPTPGHLVHPPLADGSYQSSNESPTQEGRVVNQGNPVTLNNSTMGNPPCDADSANNAAFSVSHDHNYMSNASGLPRVSQKLFYMIYWLVLSILSL